MAYLQRQTIFGCLYIKHNLLKKLFFFVFGLFHMMIASGSLLGDFVVDYFNENILIYGVLSFILLALLSIFTLAKGLNNPKISCENEA